MPPLPLKLAEKLARIREFKATKIKAKEEQNWNHQSICILALFTYLQALHGQWFCLCHASGSPGELVKIWIDGPTLRILDSVGQGRGPKTGL